MFEIEKGIPVHPARNRTKYPFAAMEVGKSAACIEAAPQAGHVTAERQNQREITMTIDNEYAASLRALFEPGGALHDELLLFVEHVNRADAQPPDWSAVPWGHNGEWAVRDNGPLFPGQDESDRYPAYGFDSKAEAEAYIRDHLEAWVHWHRGEAS